MSLYAIGGSRARVLALAAIGVAAFALAFVVTHTSHGAAGSNGDGATSVLQSRNGGAVPPALSSAAALPPLGSNPSPPSQSSAPRVVAVRTATVRPATRVVTPPVTSSPRRVVSRAPTPVPTPAPTPVRRAAPKRSQPSGTSFDDSG